MNNSSNPFQSVVTLGKLHNIYGYNSFYRNNRFILSGVTLASMLCCLSMTAYAFVDDARHPSSTSSDISPMFLIGVVALMLLIGMVIIFQAIREWWRIRHVAVALFDQGMAYQHADGSMHLIPWNSIQEVKDLKYRKRQVVFTDYLVKTNAGNSYLLYRTLKDIHQLGALVKQNAGMGIRK